MGDPYFRVHLSRRPNAFELISYAKNISRILGEDFKPILEDMISSDYDNLIAVFRENYSEYIEIC